ncbi:site-2 protease family protein [Ureibacillus sp. FSL K6-3587]|jgi:stage IV sporulation protein FB|uniref:site-2 protease family protein n=1 Tax=unclassified Ureibacillus TaxID=2638520 RepID=UPI0031585A49
MDERAYAAMMRMTIHPLFLPLLFGLILYGNVSYYALILSSLLIHELGHLLVAWLLGVKVERCVIMPYGGEIELKGGYALSPHKQLLISIGGPVATFCCMLMAPFLDPLLAKPLIKIQMVLLLINLIPVWPLDGGRIVFSLILIFSKKAKTYELFLAISFILITLSVIITFVLLPKTIFLFILAIFLWIKVIQEWRYRKYRIAFEKYVLNRLT